MHFLSLRENSSLRKIKVKSQRVLKTKMTNKTKRQLKLKNKMKRKQDLIEVSESKVLIFQVVRNKELPLPEPF
jgi:hypothetical protein